MSLRRCGKKEKSMLNSLPRILFAYVVFLYVVCVADIFIEGRPISVIFFTAGFLLYLILFAIVTNLFCWLCYRILTWKENQSRIARKRISYTDFLSGMREDLGDVAIIFFLGFCFASMMIMPFLKTGIFKTCFLVLKM